MANSIQSIPLGKLIAHPDNPNRMSKANFGKLVRNIGQTGRYEPIIVRPHPQRKDCFQIINGEHRCKALAKLGYNEVDSIVWDADDEQADILLATLNRLAGTDLIDNKIALLKRLSKKTGADELAKLLPTTAKQIERLVNVKIPRVVTKPNAKCFSNPMVFFVNDAQQATIESALSSAQERGDEKTKAAKRATALAQIAGHFLNHSESDSRS